MEAGTQQLMLANQSQMPTSIAVKAFFTTIDEIHRFNLNMHTSFSDFCKQLAQLFNQYIESNTVKEDENFLEEFEKKMTVGAIEKDCSNVNNNDLVLKYQDDEDDWISLKSEQVRRKD
jgi:hypothetical protein